MKPTPLIFFSSCIATLSFMVIKFEFGLFVPVAFAWVCLVGLVVGGVLIMIAKNEINEK